MRSILCLVLFFCLSVTAQASDYVSSEAHGYRLSCNKDGYVLTSSYPVFRFVENGAMSRVETLDPEMIYLGKSCDASHKVLGRGQWCWSNGGFRVSFGGHNIGFPRQELGCDVEVLDPIPCGC